MAILTIPPAYKLSFGDSAEFRIEAVAFAADGRLYAEVSDFSLSIWSVLIFHWPELLGGVLAALLVILAVSVLRIVRRPQAVGMPHCRRCNYNLFGSVADGPCPECGVDPRRVRPRTGRTRRRRLLVPLSAASLLIAGYAAMHVTGVPRVNGASYLVSWTSPRLAAFAKERDIAWLVRQYVMDRSLVEIDPASGRVLRTVRRIGPYSAFRASLSPDGRTAVTTLHRGELAAIDLSSGRTVRTVHRLDGGADATSRWSGSCWRHVAGWLDDENVCVQSFDAAAGTHGLYRWNIRTGELALLADIPIPVRKGGPATSDAVRLLYLVPGADPPMAWEVQDGHAEDLSYGESSTIGVRDLAAGGRLVREFKHPFWSNTAPVPLPHGSAFFIRGWGGAADILLGSLTDGILPGGLEAPGFMGTLQDGPAGLAYHAPTGRLFVATANPEAVHVRDTVAKRWIARLPFGFDGLPDDVIAISPDGRWAAIAVTGTAGYVGPRGGPGQFTHHLLIFDLSSLEGGGGPPAGKAPPGHGVEADGSRP